MRLSSYRTMDPRLIPGLVNTALRNDCEDLEDLLRSHDLKREDFLAKMEEIGFRYLPESNQFRPISGKEK